MPAERFHDTVEWRDLREQIRERDGRCLLWRLGDCHGLLDVHHIDPVSEGRGDPLDPERCFTACRRHHPMIEAVIRRSKRWRRCTHDHRYPGAREACERRLNAA